MVLLFPQWQGANRRKPIEQGTKTLEQYYGTKITHRIIMENHAMITSNPLIIILRFIIKHYVVEN